MTNNLTTSKVVIWILVVLILLDCASALGVSPASIYFENVARGGYAQQEVLVSDMSVQNVSLSYEVIGADWISVEFDSPTASFGNPTTATIIAAIPDDVANGDYEITIRLFGTPKTTAQDGKASSITVGVTINLVISVIGEELSSCVVGGVDISNIESGFPLTIATSIKNTGNVRINPEASITVYDQNKELVMLFENYAAGNIMPTASSQNVENIENKLAVGQYWAYLSIPNCDFMITETFEVVEKGAIVDTGELSKIIVPISASKESIVPIQAVFKNTGSRTVFAKLRGQILKDDAIISTLETDAVEIAPGDSHLFDTYFEPQDEGAYIFRGEVVYNNKLSFEKEAVMEITGNSIVDSEKYSPNSLVIVIVLAIIALLLLIIKKKKDKKTKGIKTKDVKNSILPK